MKVIVKKAKSGSSLTASKAAEILHDGTAQGHPLTPKQRRFMGWKSHQKAENGLSILDSNTVEFNGPSHGEGGIPIKYAGKKVEVEGKETGYISPEDNSLHIMGNMFNPLTGKKFKEDSKILANKENRVNKFIGMGNELLSSKDPKNKWESLAFNSGKAMLSGGLAKKKELQQSKEQLAVIQKAMLDRANELGADPHEFSKGKLTKAKYGAVLTAAWGGHLPDDGGKKKQSVAQRHNNPGNIKFASWETKYGAVQGEPAPDGGFFAKFPSIEQGQKAMKALLFNDYKGYKVEDAINRWTYNKPYDEKIWGEFKGRKISDLNPTEKTKLLNMFTQGEDSKSYNWDTPSTTDDTPTDYTKLVGAPPSWLKTYKDPSLTTAPENTPVGTTEDANTTAGNWKDYLKDDMKLDYSPYQPDIPSNAKGLSFNQILPELYTAATNKVEPVHMQQYNPQLYSPYQVSFQDRRNLNNSTFRALTQRFSDNPQALATLGAQKYEADNQVNAEEFRQNQEISSDITNKNIGLLNDAQEKNLALADTQYTRQTQARANTKQINQGVLKSIADKLHENELEQKTLQTYENLYDYRMNPNGRMQYYGVPGNELLSFPESGQGGDDQSNDEYRTTTKTDYKGRTTVTKTKNPSSLTQSRQLGNTQKAFNIFSTKYNFMKSMDDE